MFSVDEQGAEIQKRIGEGPFNKCRERKRTTDSRRYEPSCYGGEERSDGEVAVFIAGVFIQ